MSRRDSSFMRWVASFMRRVASFSSAVRGFRSATCSVTLVMAALTLVPTHYVHPARVKRFRAFNIAAVGLWLVGAVWLVLSHPERPLAGVVMSVGGGVWLLAVGLIRTAHGEDA